MLGTLQANTRKDLQNLLVGYGEALNGEPQPGEDDDQDPDTKGETGGEALNDSLEYSAGRPARPAIVNQALLGTELHDISKLIAGQQKVTAALVEPRGQPQGPDHELEHHHGGARGPGERPARDDARAAAGARGGAARRSTTSTPPSPPRARWRSR